MNETKGIVGFTIAHATIVTVLMLLFLWPAGGSEPRELPIGLVGPAQQTSQMAAMIESQQPGALAITEYESRTEAEAAIDAREIYGALVLGPQPEAVVASGANASVAALIQDLGDSLVKASLRQQGMQVPELKVTDRALLPESDPRGMVFGSSSLPLVIGGISLGALASLRLRRVSSRIALATSASITTGFVAAAVLGGIFGALPGDYLMNALAMSAVIGAIGFALIGMHAVMGLAGFGIMAATLFLIGNPLNGVAMPAEFYPEGWGVVGQLMPIGAGFELIKRINFFELADQSTQWWVLTAWIVVGLGLSLLKIQKQPS